MTHRGAIFFLMQVALLLANATCLSEGVAAAYHQAEFEDAEAKAEAEVEADQLNWTEHPCRRDCKDQEPPMECRYAFRLEAYRTMSKACYDCPLNLTDCFRPHCVPADGVGRSILVVNRQMPGPPIEVCQGDRVIVDVSNWLHSESTTMHWHGQHHVRTPYMDGVPYVSQCPILPASTFRYDYVATEVGTHFWHSHLGFQRGDGVFGALIVRAPPKLDWHRSLYRTDRHTILLSDWTHQLGIDKFLNHHHAGGDNKPPNLLINGFGRFAVPVAHSSASASASAKAPASNGSAAMPLATFVVERNTTHRFRLINAEFLNCPIELSIDKHVMRVISSDGRDIEPVEAESLVSYAGERFDFVVETNQKPANYWMRFRGLMDCDERFTKAYQVAILRYEGASEDDPEGEVGYDYERDSGDSKGQRVNALNEGMETGTSVSIPLLKAMDRNDKSSTAHPDYQFYVSYDFYQTDNPHFHRGNLYGFNQVKVAKRVLTPQLNRISMKLPPVPLLSQRDLVKEDGFCNASTVHGCEHSYCACTHVLRVRLDSVVEVVLVDQGFAYDANHPFHLHGYQFRVVAMERVGKTVTVDQVKALDAKGAIRRKLDRAPLKDTVTVPDGGYTVLRFHANNPGYWLFHCHIEFHAEVGMSLVFKVGEHRDMAPVPRDFPRCGNWKPEREPANHSDSTNAAKDRMPIDESWNATKQQTTEIGLLHLVKLLPQLLSALHISTSAAASPALLPSYSLIFFTCFLPLLFNFS